MFLFPPCPAWTMSSCLILKDDYFGDVCGQAILWGKVHGMTAAVKESGILMIYYESCSNFNLLTKQIIKGFHFQLIWNDLPLNFLNFKL